jgi:predicted cupin superfamily sugar epimerase
MKNAKDIIAHFNMQVHPEGGYYKEVYRNTMELIFPGFQEPRSACTSIYFLLEKGQYSSMHRIKSDEIWYFHAGNALEIIERDEHGIIHVTRLGPDFLNGEKLQHIVPAGRWFGARLPANSEFALVGCQVSPGFDFRDFELAPAESRKP